jgi:hypothetical protein
MAITTTTTTVAEKSTWHLAATAAGADQFAIWCDAPAEYVPHTSLPAETVMGERRDWGVPYRITASASADKIYIRCAVPGGFRFSVSVKLA